MTPDQIVLTVGIGVGLIFIIMLIIVLSGDKSPSGGA